MGTLIVMLFIPKELPLWSFAFDVAVVFAGAQWLAHLIPGLGRAFTPREEREHMVRAAAAATFLARGVHRCKARNGLLVYVSVLEQAVEVVGNLAIDTKQVEAPRAAAHAALLAGDLDAFVAAVEQFGPALASAHPRSDDDVNELRTNRLVGERRADRRANRGRLLEVRRVTGALERDELGAGDA